MNSLAVLVIFGLISTISCSPISKATFKNVGIVGGNDTTIEANPWQVSIQLLGLHSCGGSIIGPDTIVTAAHCIDPLMPILYSVFLGTNNLLSNDSQRVGIKQAFYHEKWDGYDYDVGIIKLAENLTYSDQVKPIKMVESGKTPLNGSEVNVTGWGVTSEGALLPPIILQGVTVNVVDHEECAKDLEEFQEVTERMLCAAVPEGGKDSCQGDSGGPLTQNGVLVGIVSWGMGCAEKDYPGVYADVAALRDWIKQKTGI